MTKEARTYSGGKVVSSVSAAGRTGQLHVKEWDWEHSLIPYTKINSKWIKAQYVNPDTIELLEENIGRTLFDISYSDILFDPPPRIMTIKTKTNQWDLIKLKSSYAAKETI